MKLIGKLLVALVILVWLSHLIQVFVPETGFDAVWYHLPTITKVIAARGLTYDPTLPQTLNPLASDLFFLIGFLVLGETGAKVVAYLFGLFVLIISYQLARFFLSKTWSLAVCLQISLLQVVAWQSASVYVDNAKAVWELSALLVLLLFSLKAQQKNTTKKMTTVLTNSRASWYVVGAGLLFGMSLGTKYFSWLLVPALMTSVWLIRRNWKDILLFSAVMVVPPLPFLIHAYQATGDAFQMVTIHIKSFGTLGGKSSVLNQLIFRTLELPLSFVKVITVRDYLSPLFIFILPTCYVAVKHWRSTDIKIKILWLFSVNQWLVWWFVPPLSTRYALAGFITLLILITISLVNMAKQHRQGEGTLLYLYLALALVMLTPRLYVNYRSSRYILGYQSKEAYIRQFFDGSIDVNLIKWHKLEDT